MGKIISKFLCLVLFLMSIYLVGCSGSNTPALPPETKIIAYVANGDSPGTVSVIDTTIQTVTATITVGTSPEGVAFGSTH